MSINLDLENTISFERPLTRVVKQNIRIENPNSTPIAYKVKTTAPKLYCVRPNSDIIAPYQSADVQIMLQAFREEPALDVKCKDKFLILSAVVEETAKSADLQDFWAHVEKNAKNSIHERKLRCVYTQPGEKTAAPKHVAAPAAAPVTASAPIASAAEPNKKNDTTTATTANNEPTPQQDKEAAERLKQMEEELKKYKREVETLRESGPIVVEKTQVIKATGYPISMIILFALLAAAVAYFLNTNN